MNPQHSPVPVQQIEGSAVNAALETQPQTNRARLVPQIASSNPLLYQINTRVLLADLSRAFGRQVTLDEIPDQELDRFAREGFNWIWLLGVWQTGSAGRAISRENPEWRREFRELLPDFSENDVCGSCFAIQSYSVHSDFGGDCALARLRQRLGERGLSLMLDFVPNHTAPDHRWVQQHTDYYVHGTEKRLECESHNYTRVATPSGSVVLAYGRDPYFA